MNLDLGYNSLGIPLEWKDPPNDHIYMTGTSGTGKSYLIKSLIPQVINQGARVVVFDCSGDYMDQTGKHPAWPPSHTEFVDLQDSLIGINPFARIRKNETRKQLASRVAGTFQRSLHLGESQRAFLSMVIHEGLDQGNFCSLTQLIELVRLHLDMDVAKRILPKLMDLDGMLPDGNLEYDWKLDTAGTTVIDLSSFNPSAQNILIEFLLHAICESRFLAPPEKESPVVLVFDECQNLSMKEGSFPNRILREGRKYQISGWFSTQWISDRETVKAMEQAALRLYFRPEQSGIHKIVLSFALRDKSQAASLERRLGTLKTGCFMYQQGMAFHFNRLI